MDCKQATGEVVAEAGSEEGASFSITQSFFPGQYYQGSGTLKRISWGQEGPTYAQGMATLPPGTYSRGTVNVLIFQHGAVSLWYGDKWDYQTTLVTYLSQLTCSSLLTSHHFHGVETQSYGELSGWLPKWTSIDVEPIEFYFDLKALQTIIDAQPRP